MPDARIRTALISVHDKTGLAELGRALVEQGAEIFSTGGTLAHLRENKIAATSIADYTGQPEILGGRVKTLHPKIFAGILARRDVAEDMKTLQEQGIKPIDLVVVSLYPFEETVSKPAVTLAEAIEQIDIGGVSLIRAAAKNHASVLVLCSPGDYQQLLRFLKDGVCVSPQGEEITAEEMRFLSARMAFNLTSRYDRAIEHYLWDHAPGEHPAHTHAGSTRFPSILWDYWPQQPLRYGENPHQDAMFYSGPGSSLRHPETTVARSLQLQGKELSYNNIIDLDSGLEVVRAFEEPTCCIIKHNNPCGVARADDLLEAYKAARECDPVSAFGGVIGFNREVDAATATEVAEMFTEAIIAPAFSEDAKAVFAKKKNLRLLETGPFLPVQPQLMLKSVIGGLLVQSRDLGMVTREQLKIVSKEQPTDEDLDGLLFAWRVAKFVKSNAIVYTSRNATIGIGAGQMSRIDSTNIAAVKARRPIRGAYMASDAFFPFRDNVDRAADIGIRAIIQPGGSVRDEEVITAADEHRMIMVFTGMRHFRH